MITKMLTQALALAALALTLATIPVAAAAQPPAGEQQEEYVPIDKLPPQEQYSAAPLIIGAYVFVPVVLFLYLVSLSRRMTAVQRDVERLEGDLKRSGRA